MPVLSARPLMAVAGIVSVAVAAALVIGPSSGAAAPVPTVRAQYAEDPSPAPTPPMPTLRPPSPGQPSPPAVPPGKPVPSPPGTDPCGSIQGIPASKECSGVAKNQTANDKCQVENFHNCNRPITGQAQDTWQTDQDGYTRIQQDFHDVRRDHSAKEGTSELCQSSSGMRERLSSADVIVPPSDWWTC